MKQVLLFLIFVLSSFLNGQELKYEDVVNIESASKDELYNRARKWVSQTFNKKYSVINVDDKELGEISASGVIDYRNKKSYFGSGCVEGPIVMNVSIYLKNGKYKYSFYTFDHKGSGGYGCKKTDYGVITTSEKAPKPSWGEPNEKAWKDIKDFINDNVLLNVNDLKEHMSKQHESSSNW